MWEVKMKEILNGTNDDALKCGIIPCILSLHDSFSNYYWFCALSRLYEKIWKQCRMIKGGEMFEGINFCISDTVTQVYHVQQNVLFSINEDLWSFPSMTMCWRTINGNLHFPQNAMKPGIKSVWFLLREVLTFLTYKVRLVCSPVFKWEWTK